MSNEEAKELDKTLFKTGDVVVLKSGGPDMTVGQIFKKGTRYDNEDYHLYCVNWFDQNGNRVADDFLEPMLKQSNEPKSSGSSA